MVQQMEAREREEKRFEAAALALAEERAETKRRQEVAARKAAAAKVRFSSSSLETCHVLERGGLAPSE